MVKYILLAFVSRVLSTCREGTPRFVFSFLVGFLAICLASCPFFGWVATFGVPPNS